LATAAELREDLYVQGQFTECLEAVEFVALGLFDAALALYGEEGNWHHRASVHYWRSYALERLFSKKEAVEAAQESITFWAQQVNLDPETESYRQRLESAVERFSELTDR